MQKTDAEFNTLMQQVLAGSETAAQELFRDYGPSLLRVIRVRLNEQTRSKFDSVDVAQDVWASFFAEDPTKRLFDTPEELVAFLTRLAHHKVLDMKRYALYTKKNNVNQERSLDDSTQFNKELLTADDPTPSQIVMSEEEWVAFLRKQPLVYQRIFVLFREGKMKTEIAAELNLDPRTVKRVLSKYDPGLIS